MLEHAPGHRPWDVPLSMETMDAAIALGEYFIAHGKAAYALMGADGRVEDARKVWATIDRQGWKSFARRDLHQHLRRSYNKEALTEVLETLASMGYIRRTKESGTRSAGRPSDWWDVNPLSRAQNPQNPQNGTMELGSGDSGDSGYGSAPEDRLPSDNTYRLEAETPRVSIEEDSAASSIGPGVSGVALAAEQNPDAHTSERRRTNPSEAELFIDDAPALDESVGMSRGEVFFGLQCGITGKRCDLCRGIPCAGSIPLDGVSR